MLLAYVLLQSTAHNVAHHTNALADQAESDYEDEDMVEPEQISTQDSDQYHGRGWRAKKAKGCSQTASMLSSDGAEAHTAGPDQQAIWNATREIRVEQQKSTSEHSSSTAYVEEASLISRYTIVTWHRDAEPQKSILAMPYHFVACILTITIFGKGAAASRVFNRLHAACNHIQMCLCQLVATKCAHIQPICMVILCCRAEIDSLADLPPVRSACTPVPVQFTKLETDHLPARETREQEISSYKRKAQVSNNAHHWLPTSKS